MIRQQKGSVRIGTSGISFPGNKQSLPAEFQLKSRLNYYGTLFNTLEVNSTFYKIPMPVTCERWSKDVPDEFQFTLKLFKEITHVKDLKFEPGLIDTFLQAADCIGNKKGCLLIQFPGKITIDYFNKVEQILKQLHGLDHGKSWLKAVEFRNASWYETEVSELLNEYAATMVLHDMPKSKNCEVQASAEFFYYRFHGPDGDYRGSYSDNFLAELSGTIQDLLKKGKDVYLNFNNTAGNAFENALRLKAMMK